MFNWFQTLSARQMITINAFFLLNMKATIFLPAMINHERIYQVTHFGVQLIKNTKVLEYVETVALKVSENNNHRMILCKSILCLIFSL